MVGVIWYRFVRYSGTDWSATLVPIRPLLWYRLERCAGTVRTTMHVGYTDSLG